MIYVILIQFILGVGLFFIINLIGKQSFSIGYKEITLYASGENAPALNFLIRVLTPVVYILIIASCFYSLKLDRFVHNIFLINIFYIAFRLLFNLITQRGKLLNWFKQIVYWLSIISISLLVYYKIIQFKKNLLPDFSSIANELWIIIIVFIFQLINRIEVSKDGAERRTNVYLRSKYKLFKSLYGDIIVENLGKEALEIIAYTILIYEDFNRPKVARWIENIRYYITKKPHSLGVMQFPTHHFINDKQSVNLGTKKIRSVYDTIVSKINKDNVEETSESAIETEIINKYNVGSKYYDEITTLSYTIKSEFYTNSTDVLLPSFSTEK